MTSSSDKKWYPQDVLPDEFIEQITRETIQYVKDHPDDETVKLSHLGAAAKFFGPFGPAGRIPDTEPTENPTI